MNDARVVNMRADLRPAFAGRGAGSLLEIDAWMPSEISAISPLVERLMAHRRVALRCGRGIRRRTRAAGSSEQRRRVENLEADHGRGIHLMKLAMDEVSFEREGTEVHMRKRLARNPRAHLRRDL